MLFRSEYSFQDDIWVTAESTAYADNDMRYVVDVIDSNAGITLARFKVYPKPNSGHLYLNINRVIQSVWAYNTLFDKPTILRPNYGWAMHQRSSMGIAIDVQIGEEINGVATLNQVSLGRTYYNFQPQHRKRYTDIYQLMLYQRPCWMTTRTLSCKAKYDDFITLPFWSYLDGSGWDYSMMVEFYQGVNKYNDYEIQDNIGVVQQCDISPSNIANLCGIGISDWYRVRIWDRNIDLYSEWFEVHLDECKEYDSISLHFVNRFGMYDTARFSLVHKKILETERKSFWKNDVKFAPNNLTQPTIDYTTSMPSQFANNTIYNETKINYSQKIDYTYKIIMDYVNDKDFEWLTDLITSPQIYLTFTEENPYFYPVTITNTNYEVFKNHYAGLKTLELDIEFNQRRNGFTR